MLVKVKVTPNSSEDKVIGMQGEYLKVKVRAPPEDGKANYAVIALLSEYYNVPKVNVIIKSGHTQKIKFILIEKTVN